MAQEPTPPSAADMTVVKTSRTPDELRKRLQTWLATTTGDPQATVGPVSSPAATGMSSESLFFDAAWRGADGDVNGSFVARLAPAAEDVPVFREYDLEKQYRLMALVGERSRVPVPGLRWLETDPQPLGVPFFVMDRVDGRVPPDLPPYAMDGWVRDLTPTDRRALQDKSVAVLAGVHDIDIADGGADFLELPAALGATPLRRHFADQRAFYDWVVEGCGRHFPLIERAFDWLDANWPTVEPASAISWGDARIGNIMYAAEGTDPVAVLDWEMAAIAPPGLDVAWMCWLHRFFEHVLGKYGIDTLPDMFHTEDVRNTYGELTGRDVGDLRFETVYNATSHAAVMARIHARSVHFGTEEWPADPDEVWRFKDLLRELIGD